MATSAEVLDHGRDREPRHRFAGAGITLLIAGGLVVAAVAGATTWWTSRPPTSADLGIVDVQVLERTSVTIVAEPPIGALATPAGAALPGISVRLRVGGDPREAIELTTSPTDSIVYVQEEPPFTIAAGSFADVDITIAPVDCTLARDGVELDEAGYRWRRAFGVEILATTDGEVVPTSPEAQSALQGALAESCAGAGDAPRLTVTAARRGGEPPLETIGLIVDVDAAADRYVLTPLDGPGLRGLGAADRRSGDGIPLLWLVSPRAEHNDDVTTAYTQVFVVRQGTAYPWIVSTAITDDLPEMTPLTTSIR